DADGGDADEGEDGGSRRRRRRRRRKTADGDADTRDDDPPNTVVHVREARPARADRDRDRDDDGVQGVRGSTRLEAKRQRRRDGREAGRRRPPILSEAEFLARREAVDRVMVVREHGRGGNGHNGHGLVQIAVLEDGVLCEHFVTSAGVGSLVGNVYLGRVQNVLPSMEAAFVDIGRGRNAVLYAGEVDWDAAGLEGKARKIEQALSTGDSVLVQVTKDPVGHKGARLTTQISLPGRFLVYVPGGGATGISRKLPDNERKRLKDILRRIVPDDAGVIIRTASEGVAEESLARDVRRLQAQWEVIKQKSEVPRAPSPQLLYEEPDLLIKVVRDLFTEDFSALVVQGRDAMDTIDAYVQHVAPELAPRLHRHVGTTDVFTEYRIDDQILKALDRKVWLPSGGYLVIDRTEAMTVIDVNTGKYTGSGGNLEETVTRNNLEAAEEVVRQLRLRDIGGIIVIDFIDMVLEGNRDLVLRRLTECLGRDRTRHQVAEVTSLGLVQMTRKRMGSGLLEAYSTPCEHCRGRGLVVSTEPIEPKSAAGQEQRDNGAGQRGQRGQRGRGKAAAPAEAPVTPEPVAEPAAA
ncbi:MAG TPA: Rne/Rng family ribonuclease, partial [Pseudonocardiaceae bacterium]